MNTKSLELSPTIQRHNINSEYNFRVILTNVERFIYVGIFIRSYIYEFINIKYCTIESRSELFYYLYCF